jgi:hypothetical protein
MVPDLNLAKLELTNQEDAKLPYHSLIGKLLYILLAMRPDITFPVCYLAFVNRYDRSH